MPEPGPPTPAASRLLPAGLLLLLLALGLFLYGRTLRLSFAYDDMDYFVLVGDVMAGKAGYWETAFRPHLEHLVPLVVMAFHASAALAGADALPFRLFVLLAHVGGAWFLALAARRYAGNAAAAATGLAYLAPAGFSSMWIWILNGAGVPLALLGWNAAMAALAARDRLGTGRARRLALVATLWALAAESTLAPLVAGPVLLDEYERRRAGKRGVGPFAASAAALAAGTVLLAISRYRALYHAGFQVDVFHGVLRAAFLVLVAPLRYLAPGFPLLSWTQGRATAVYGSLAGILLAAAAGALLAAAWRRSGPPRLALVAALAAPGPLAVVLLAGLGRWQSTFAEIYDADRYFFYLLPPLALLAGAAAAEVARRWRGWERRQRAALALLLAAAGGAELVLHRRALLARVPFGVFAAHEHRLDQLSRLASRLSAAAGERPATEPPLRFPDDSFWFPDVHNGRISARFVLHALARRPRPVLGDPGIDERDERRLNPLLAAWAREVGEPLPFFAIAGGRLVNARDVTRVDFAAGPYDAQVAAGFEPWDGAARWMGPRGELRLAMRESFGLGLTLAAPLDALRRAHPDWRSLDVRVTLIDEGSGVPVPLGTVAVREDGARSYLLDASPLARRLGNGRPVRLVLECDETWRPADVLPGSTDPRQLTVQVLAAGF